MRIHRFFIAVLLVVFLAIIPALAQSETLSARLTQWDSYALPAAEYTRYINKKQGYSLWRPAAWQEMKAGKDGAAFGLNEQEKSILVLTETLPEGYGVANYATAMIQQFRKQPINPDTIAMRHVLLGGVEAREITLELEGANGQPMFQAYWVTQVGPAGFAFVFTTTPENKEKLEPHFKRLLMSVRFTTAGHWDEDFETLHAKFSASNKSTYDGTAAQISEALRTAKIAGIEANHRLAEIVTKAPAIALEMLTDYDPNVRAAAIAALGKSAEARFDEALLWALTDKDAYCSASAAQTLVGRGTAANALVKTQLAKLSKNDGALLRYAALLSDNAARELADELLQSNERNLQLNGLQMALLLPLKGLKLPYAQLFMTADLSVISYTMEAIRLRHPAEDANEFAKMIGTDAELWAVHALGEIAAPALSTQLEERRKILDTRYQALLKSKGVMTIRGSIPPPPPPPPMPGGKVTRGKRTQFSPPREILGGVPGGVPGGIPPMIVSAHSSSPASTPPALFKSQTELTKLWSLTNEFADALNKIKWRDRWAIAKDEDERKKILAETKQSERLNEWAKATLKKTEAAPASNIDWAKLKNATTTGETIFPQQAMLYLTAPNFEQTINKLDAALSGIQMGTVRDQMTFALMLNGIKAQLANKMNLALTGSATSTLGIDLHAPVSMAAWADKENSSLLAHSAVVLRVTDRARFERTLTTYQNDFGSFDSFVPVFSAGARFASITPAVLPLAFYAFASGSDFASTVTKSGRSKSKAPQAPFSLESSVYVRQEKIGDVPITVFEKLNYVGIDATRQEAIYVAYLGDTAVVAPSRMSLLEALTTDKATINTNQSYSRIKAENGELIYFSQLDKLFQNFYTEIVQGEKEKDPADTFITEALSKAIGAETGAMRLSQNTWESVFHLPAGDTEFMQTVRPFKATELNAPRDLLPRHTLFYAATMIDLAKFSKYGEKWDAELAAARQAAGKDAKKEGDKSGDTFSKIYPLVTPHLQGEISFALLSVANLFKNDSFSPSFAVALKLKNDTLAKTARSGLASFVLKRIPDVMALNAPVFKLSDEENPYVATVTDDYFIVADSVASLRLLEGKEKFSTARDFIRPASVAPEKLAFFSTYNIDAAFAEARAIMNKGADKGDKDDDANYLIDTMSAWSHAFHSQRMLLAFTDEKTLEGQLGVSFDREGNFNVGAMSRKEFDLENALLAPKGVNITNPTRVASLKIKVSAQQPGVIARVQEDLSKFAWHKIEPNTTANSLIFTTTQRRIPDNLTIKLPVKGTEFEPYLQAKGKINSSAPEIVNLAKEIAGKEKDGRKIAQKIGQWTFENLKWKRVSSTTVETLASREADCLEHAELYTALARALGLPARVVSGAAFGGGSFGAHAWVEIYLGQWVEIDPTWGLTDHVDATHLRFDGNGFISYAQLNQVDFEILAAHAMTADFQVDPVTLVKKFGAEENDEMRALAFDFDLTAQQLLSAEAAAKLTPKQRAAMMYTFDKAVADIVDEWALEWDDNPLILAQEVKNDRATIQAVLGNGLLRFSLAARNGAWYVTEIENEDEGLLMLGEPLRGALQPNTSLAKIRKLQGAQPGLALAQIDKVIAANGETAPLLLLKANILEAKHARELQAQKEQKNQATQTELKISTTEKNKMEPRQEFLVLRQKIAARWPDYAPAQYALAQTYQYQEGFNAQAVTTFQQYAKLMPLDPRPWRALGELLEEMKRPNEAETALREALARDRENVDAHGKLIAFCLRQAQREKAKETLAAGFKQTKNADSLLYMVDWEVLHEPEETTTEMAQHFEELLLSFPKELAHSEEGLRGLSEAQRILKKYDAAIKTLQKVVTLNPEGNDQVTIAEIYRETKRYALALTAASLAVKQDPEYVKGHFERACALAQLGRKREAITALKKVIELDKSFSHQFSEEEDLQVLAALAEFKTLLPKPEETAQEPKADQPQSAKP